MGVRILYNSNEEMATLYCSTSDWSFGPVFYSERDYISAYAFAERFIKWLPQDVRLYKSNELEKKYIEFKSLNWHQCLNLCDKLIPEKDDMCEECLEEKEEDGITLCPHCNCMTHSLLYNACGKCHKTKEVEK